MQIQGSSSSLLYCVCKTSKNEIISTAYTQAHNLAFYSYARRGAGKVQDRYAIIEREETGNRAVMLDVRMPQWKLILLWVMLLILAVLVTYFGIRGYLSPEMLFNLANSFSC